MSKKNTVTSHNKIPAMPPLVDEYGNQHHLGEELARGGQGVVYRTKDADLAIKQPLDASGSPDKNANLKERFQNIRILPLPPRIPISLPLSILRNEPGYVMRLLNGMNSFGTVFDLDGKTKATLRESVKSQDVVLPHWIAQIPDVNFALLLFHYVKTGSTRRRLFALSKCASILARLHSAGLVYGDISPNNVFIGEGDSRDVWLIDADNLRFEWIKGGSAVYTPRYGAPEIVRAMDQSRPRTDCWAFAVMAFGMLSLCHPFIGKKVLEPDDDEGGWDAEPLADGTPSDLDEQAYAGYLPFIDDNDDDSNANRSGLPRELVTTQQLRRLFQETFGTGRTQPHRRHSMAFWAVELARAFDLSLICPGCGMSYFAADQEKCPYCDTARPTFIRATTSRWRVLIPGNAEEFVLPHRLFHPFSFEYNDDTAYEAVLNFAEKTAIHRRGTRPFPDGLTFDFVEEAT